MLNLKEELKKDVEAGLAAAIKDGKLDKVKDVPVVVIEVPENEEHGDYATPVALALARQINMKPLGIVEEIGKKMPKKEYVGRIKAVEPGFLNIWLNPGWMTARLDNVIEQGGSGAVTVGKGKSVNLEFISANPTGPLTLGNIRTAFSVDTMGYVLEAAGYNVTREYYFNDAGAQIKKLGEAVLRRILQDKEKKIDYPEDMYQGGYINELGAVVAEKIRENEGRELAVGDLDSAEAIKKVSAEAVAIMLSKIKKMIRRDLRIKFDVWTSEEELRAKGKIKKAIDELERKGELYDKDGAKWMRTTKYGDSEDRVIVKSDGEYAYIAPDIGYHQDKYDRGFDEIFTFVGADHQGHLPKIEAAMKILGNDISRLHLVTAQWLGIIKGGKVFKLSKRAGQIVTPKDLIDEIGYDAARFFMVQQALTTHMDLDLDLAKERSERNPVYYVQYAYVRLQSVLRRAKERGIIAGVGERFDLSDNPPLTHSLELALMRQIYRWPEIIYDVAVKYEVHDLAYYAHDLAKVIHVFYRHVTVLSDDKEITRGRLQLVLAAKQILGETLELIGVSKPEVM